MVDDAVQEVFLECFRENGVLVNAQESPPRSFRALLLGVVHNIAQRVERRWRRTQRRLAGDGVDVETLPSLDPTISKMFDRAWAAALIQHAKEIQRERAESEADDEGDAARSRVRVLELRFAEGLPIREIAARWGQEPTAVHRLYRRARREFRACLREAVAFHHPGANEAFENEYQRLLSLIE
jgi:RNA polymerase sigma-70 factor (ECF subfamily)